MTPQEPTTAKPILVLVSTDALVRDRFVEGTESLAVLVPCQSADAAFDVMARQPVAVVLLDGQQSSIAPWQFAERLRAEHPEVDLALLAGDEYGDEEEDLREGWLAGVVSRNSAKRTLRAAVRRLIQSQIQSREYEALQGSVRVLEQCRQLMSCLEPGRVYPVALDIVLGLLNRNQAIAVFQRESVPMSDALVFRGLGESESQRLRELFLEEKPFSGQPSEQIEIVDSGAYLSVLREAGIVVERLLMVPLKGRRSEAGMLWILESGVPFDDAEIAQVKTVASYAVTALMNCERYHHAKERAFIDDVTEVYNARYLLATTDNEIRRAERYETPLSVLFLDLDRFKVVNDEHGHLIGSQILRNLSQVLIQCVRDVDTLARYGGDEFTILLVDTDHAEAMSVAERIRRTVEDHVFEAGRSGTLRLTVSIGVGTYPQHGVDRTSLLDVSDKAMYRSKSMGRNQICSANELTI